MSARTILNPPLNNVLGGGGTGGASLVNAQTFEALNTFAVGINIEGVIEDSLGSSGTSGQVLTSLGTTIKWEDATAPSGGATLGANIFTGLQTCDAGVSIPSTGGLKDSNGSYGALNDVLISTGTAIEWVVPSGGGGGATLEANTFTGLQTCDAGIATTYITATTVEGATTIATTATGVVECGSVVANTSLTVPTINVNTISPGAGQAFTQIISGEVDTAVYGTGGNAFVIGVNSQQTPFPAGGTQIIFETFTSTTNIINPLSLTTTTVNVNVPIVPSYTYPVANTSAIGYTASPEFGGGFNASSANTLYNIAQATIPYTGLWLITGQCGFSSTGNVLSINTVLNTINQYCALTGVSSGSTQCSNVFNLTSGTVVNLVSSVGQISNISNIYFTYTRIA